MRADHTYVQRPHTTAPVPAGRFAALRPDTLDDPGPNSSDYCGDSVAIGDVNADGRADALVGCWGDDDYHRNILVNSDARGTRTVQSTRLNQQAGTITTATVTAQWIDNGGTVALAASADGGTTWDVVTSGVAHTFTVPGGDLRVRVKHSDNPWSRFTSTPYVHDLGIDYTYTPANAAPGTPALSSPANGAVTIDPAQLLVTTFSGPDGADTGTIDLEVCSVAMSAGQTCTAAGGVVRGAGSSTSGIANGANGSWAIAPALTAAGTYHWHARARDQSAATRPGAQAGRSSSAPARASTRRGAAERR